MLPKRRISKMRKGKRRAHHALSPVRTVTCKHCGHTMLPHTACANCGQYRGRAILEVAKE